jgi:hypothetical protein
MKKYSVLWQLLLAAALFIGFSSCLSTRGNKNPEGDRPELAPVDKTLGARTTPASSISTTPMSAAPITSTAPVLIPDWVKDPGILKGMVEEAGIDSDTVYVGIGWAKNNSDDLQAIQMAEARARQDIASQQGAQVNVKIFDISGYVTGDPKENKLDKYTAENHIDARQSINGELLPVKVVMRDKGRDGTWWVVVTSPKKSASAITTNRYDYTDNAARAFRLMENSLEKNRPNRR